MSKGFEPPVELDIAADDTQRSIVLLIHAAAMLPTFSMPAAHAGAILLLVAISLFFHFRQLNRRRWRALLLLSGGNLMLLDDTDQANPAELLACTLRTANVLILVIRVAEHDLNVPVFRWRQSEPFRQLRRYLLKYPPAKSTSVNSPQDKSVPNGHRRRSESVF